MKLAALITHPVQYYTPLFRELARRADLTVFFGHSASCADHEESGFGVRFDWDIDLLSGYKHVFLDNVAARPSLNTFAGVDTPSIGPALRRGGFDALLLTGWYRKTHLQALAAAKRSGLPVLVRGDSHLDTPRSYLKTFVKRATFRPFLQLFDAALYVGERNRAYLRHYGYPEGRLFHSPHCVDNAWFAARATEAARAEIRSRFGIESKARVVLFAGKLVPFKRPLDIVAAVGRLRRAGVAVEMLVAGAGELESALREAATVEDAKVHTLGFCNQTEMPKAYAACDVLALPSDGRETWGLVVNETLACGRPVIVSDAVGCAPDLAEDGVAGRVFRSGDVDDLAAKLVCLLKHPPSTDAILRKSQQYSIDRAAEGILEGATLAIKKRKALA